MSAFQKFFDSQKERLSTTDTDFRSWPNDAKLFAFDTKQVGDSRVGLKAEDNTGDRAAWLQAILKSPEGKPSLKFDMRWRKDKTAYEMARVVLEDAPSTLKKPLHKAMKQVADKAGLESTFYLELSDADGSDSRPVKLSEEGFTSLTAKSASIFHLFILENITGRQKSK